MLMTPVVFLFWNLCVVESRCALCIFIEMLWLILRRNCWQNYVDFYRCKAKKGDDYKDCNYFKKIFGSLCPNEWVSLNFKYNIIFYLTQVARKNLGIALISNIIYNYLTGLLLVQKNQTCIRTMIFTLDAIWFNSLCKYVWSYKSLY